MSNNTIPNNPFITNEGLPTPKFKELLKICSIQFSSIDQLNVVLQDKWRMHCTHSGDIPESAGNDTEIPIELLTDLGVLGEPKLEKKEYEYALLYGAYITAIRKRVAKLAQLYYQGVRFNEIVWLGGQRPAHPTKELPEILNNPNNGILQFSTEPLKKVAETEFDIMKEVERQSSLPENWRDEAITRNTFVNTPLQINREKKDPTATDTIHHWLDTKKPKPGACLGIYSQPSVMHQQIASGRILEPKGFSLDMTGYAVEGEPNIPQALDAIAKAVYEISCIAKN